MSLTRLKYLMQEGTDDEIAQYLRGLGLANGAPLIGEIFYWPSQGKPHELFSTLKGMVFFECNGQAFDGNIYPELAKVLPSKVLPELRGEFIRCWDDGRGVDAGRQVASYQEGTGFTEYLGDGGYSSGRPPSMYYTNQDAINYAGSGFVAYGGQNMSAAGIANYIVGRPRNVALQALIRAK